MMNTMKKSLVLFIGLLMLAMAAAGCGGGTPAKPEAKSASVSRIDQIKKNGKLILATGNYRPFEYHDEKTNKVIGYDIDVAEAITKKISMPLVIQEMQFTGLIPFVPDRQGDFCLGPMFITTPGQEGGDLADPYMDTGMI